jgi:hypothetical protein
MYNSLDIKEENKNLKYKIELMSIDRNDYNLQYETKFNTLKTLLAEELNSLNDALAEVGFEYPNDMRNFSEEAMAIFFQNARKAIRSLKLRVKDQENEISIIFIFNLNFTRLDYLQNENINLKDEKRKLKEGDDFNGPFKNSDRLKNFNFNYSNNYDDFRKQPFQSNDDVTGVGNHHKNRLRDLERELDEFKRENIQSSNAEFVSFRPNFKNDILNKENLRESEYNYHNHNNHNNNYNPANFETFQSTSSLENFKRNKVFI